jgi:hypothetical protein
VGKIKYLFALMFVFMLLAILAITTSIPGSRTLKPKASEYLDVKPIPGGSLGEISEGKYALIYLIALNVTAKKDATYIMVRLPFSAKNPEYQYAYKDKLAAGESWQVVGGGEEGSFPMMYSKPYRALFINGYYRVQIGIKCAESEPEDIYVYLSPEDILPLSGD